MSGSATLPRVTAIMPTRDRRRFVGQALEYFRRQDYPDVEMVIVDDGGDRVADLVADADPRIRYVGLPTTRSIGAKRNIACDHSSGEIIAHWDDDDWSAPDRISRQVAALVESAADVCALADVPHYRPLNGDAWRTSSGDVEGGSILYRRTTWEMSPFDDVNVAEDVGFLARITPERCRRIDGDGLMVFVDHGRNASGRSPSEPRWRRIALDDIASLLSGDRAFYTMLRGGPVLTPRRQRTTDVTVAADYDVFSGYGTTAEYLALSMARAGATVSALAMGLVREGLTAELLSMMERPVSSDEQPIVYHSWVRPDFSLDPSTRDVFISTMWEADRLPKSWVPVLQQATAVIVPTTFVADTARSSGVTRPIAVVPLGVNPDVHHQQPREQRQGLGTLIVAPVDDRKHTRLAISAWKRAFEDDPDARLVIKTAYGYHNYEPDDSRISYVDRVEITRGLVDYYRNADILMALGNEGFGMPLVEGMACGLPVVALNTEGQGDVCRDAGDLVLSVGAVGKEPHAHEIVGGGGMRSIPDEDAVVDRLRWVAEHREEARELGRKASQWAVTHRNVWSLGSGVLDVVSATARRPPRAVGRRTIWVPTLGGQCGVADTTQRLQRNAPSVSLTAGEPRLDSGGVVHVEHEPSIFEGGRLERFLTHAREKSLPVAVTEHAVFPDGWPWESQAAALVATTAAGTEVLRRRHPRLRVEHIPLGCETWTLPRKRDRGRTIGFFGFPRGHKGLDALAEAARRVPRCEVVLYAYLAASSPVPVILDTWPADVPLRWDRSWLPMPDLAARMAAETDVLVLPYREVEHISASSAAPVGLSTGVPVLTSASSWFTDLGGAVHRYGDGANDLATELNRLLEDEALREGVTDAAQAYCAAHSWSRVAGRHIDLWNSIESG